MDPTHFPSPSPDIDTASSHHLPWRVLTTPLLAAALLLGSVTALHAEDRWVTDQCSYTMRRGPDETFKIVKMLLSGEKLELLERGDGWDRLRAANGREGWVLRRFLSPEPPPGTRVQEAEQARLLADQERDRLRDQVRGLQAQLEDQKALRDELDNVRRISGNALQLEQDNRRLGSQNGDLTTRLQQSEEARSLLERQRDTQFFLSGVAVFLLGVLGGAMLRRRKRYSNSLM
ncbi:MAG: TIGR04211 family SH3 domain-containing protein [Magnetococcus sp. WYHC-3]